MWPSNSLAIFLGLLRPSIEISVMVPSKNQKELVSVEHLTTGKMALSTLTPDGSICYGPFDQSNRSGEC